jgi:glutathione S-transferase
MADIVLTTYDWVPEPPRGFVRDLRVRWALEEAGLPYRVESTSFHDRKPEHFAHQPFGQIPWLTDGDLCIFESGAILLHLGELSDKLMPAEPRGRSDVKEWLFASLASVEAATQPWSFYQFSGDTEETHMRTFIDGFVEARLKRMEMVLAGREWLIGNFSVADILMADVLRLVDRFDGLADYPACKAYVDRAVARPAFVKAHADQMTHFAAADAKGQS